MIGLIDAIEKDILVAAYDDFAGLWEFYRFARREMRDADDAMLTWVVLAMVADLLLAGLIVAGEPNGREFEVREGSVPDTVRFIAEQLEAMGRPPEIGEVIWFKPTPRGDEIAWRLVSHGERRGRQTLLRGKYRARSRRIDPVFAARAGDLAAMNCSTRCLVRQARA